jgi:uncharacterized protein YdiU (UPF0061 family)
VPVTERYRPDPRHPQLGSAFFDRVKSADFPKSIIRFRNDRWAAVVGLDKLTDAEWVAHFGRFEPLPGNLDAPHALRYHGHQFRSYNPDLGDGRGFLFAQVRDSRDSRLLDLATKGSGQTPWSRRADGRLTLKGGVREVLATEMLEALGCYTSKTFSLIETGEALVRHDEPSPTRSSVLVRLGHSHIRIGTFQRLAALGDQVSLKALVDYSIENYWPESASRPDPVAAFFASTAEAVATMAAEWFAAGFVHGVLNTDNTVITGESFDYGPWRFLPTLDPSFTAAYFDETRLYAFGRQAGAVYWNLERLAECLLPLSTEAGLVAGLQAFGPAFERALVRTTLARLGIEPEPDEPVAKLAQPYYVAVSQSEVPFERAFFDLIAGAQPERIDRSPFRETYQTPLWQPVIDMLRSRAKSAGAVHALAHPYFARTQPVTMLIEDVEGLWAPIAESDDWSRFESVIADIRIMGEAYEPLLRTRRGQSISSDTHRP